MPNDSQFYFGTIGSGSSSLTAWNQTAQCAQKQGIAVLFSALGQRGELLVVENIYRWLVGIPRQNTGAAESDAESKTLTRSNRICAILAES